MAEPTSHLPAELQARLDSEIEDGESIVWAGQPDAMNMAKGLILSAGVVGAVLCLFGALLTASATGPVHGVKISQGMQQAFIFIGLMVLFPSFLLILSPFAGWADAKRTIYAITDRRAIIISGGKRPVTESYSAADIGNIEVIAQRSGLGDVFFAPYKKAKHTVSSSRSKIGFIGIPNAAEVAGLIVKLAETKQSGG